MCDYIYKKTKDILNGSEINQRDILSKDIYSFQHMFIMITEGNDKNQHLFYGSENFSLVLINIYKWTTTFIKEYTYK